MNPVSRICPITDPEAERLVRPATFADLSAQITATPPPEVGPAPGTRQLAPAGRGRRRPRRPIRAPLAAALALALLATAAASARRSAACCCFNSCLAACFGCG